MKFKTHACGNQTLIMPLKTGFVFTEFGCSLLVNGQIE